MLSEENVNVSVESYDQMTNNIIDNLNIQNEAIKNSQVVQTENFLAFIKKRITDTTILINIQKSLWDGFFGAV